jgi:hypothetical protein
MESVRESWTDDRLDDFRANVGQRFDRVDQRFDGVENQIQDLRGEMKEGFEAVAKSQKQLEQQWNTDFKAMHRLLVQSAIGLVAAFAAIVVGLLGIIATQV